MIIYKSTRVLESGSFRKWCVSKVFKYICSYTWGIRNTVYLRSSIWFSYIPACWMLDCVVSSHFLQKALQLSLAQSAYFVQTSAPYAAQLSFLSLQLELESGAVVVVVVVGCDPERTIAEWVDFIFFLKLQLRFCMLKAANKSHFVIPLHPYKYDLRICRHWPAVSE